MADTTIDTTTQSNPYDVATEHVTFDWTVDFENEVLKGYASHSLKVKKDGITEVMSVLPFHFFCKVFTDRIIFEIRHCRSRYRKHLR